MLIGQIARVQKPVPYANMEKEVKRVLAYTGTAEMYNKLQQAVEWIVPHLDSDALLGIEIEVENIVGNIVLPGFIHSKPDNSLRNNGMEFTSVPLSPPKMYQALVLLWILLYKTNKQKVPEFSWRTSTHLHVDVQSMTENQFKVFLILSLVFEKLLFQLSGEDRIDSIFCVPIGESSIQHYLKEYIHGKRSLHMMVEMWPKYSAVHPGRIFDQPGLGPGLGTLEFRHRAGTKNLSQILLWITVIVKLYSYAKKISLPELQKHLLALNIDSYYFKWIGEIFSPQLASKFKIKDYPEIFSHNVSLAKSLLTTAPKLEVREKSSFAKYLKADLKKNSERVLREKEKQMQLKAVFNKIPQINVEELHHQWQGVEAGPIIFDDEEV